MMRSPISAPVIPFFALVASSSLPHAAAKINISPDTISAIVTTVPIKNVAERTISWTNTDTDVASHFSLMLVLMPSVS